MSVLKPEFPDHSSPFSREQERHRKLHAIVSAAAERFNAQGFAHTRLEDVAADLGLTKTSISYYFAGKEDLAEAVFKAAADFLQDAINSAKHSGGDAASKILALFNAYAAQLEEAAVGRRVHLAALRDLDALPDTLRVQISERASDCVAQINSILKAWIEETSAPLGRPEPATFLVLELLDWLGEHQGNTRGGIAIQAAHEAVCELVSQGLSARDSLMGSPRPLDLASDEAPAIFDRDARNRMKREAFLKAGVRLFNQKGFGGASLAEVASALGVTRGAFYYHIQDKEQFLDQCLDRSLESVERALDRADETDLGPLDRLHSVLSELIYRQASGVEPLLRPGMAAVLPPARQRRYRSRMQTISHRLGDILSDGASCGEIRAREASISEDIVSSVVFWNGGYTLAAANSFSNWRASEDPRTATRDYLHLLFHGLKGPA
jgi:AcrR family transcriptional regulator